jgi:hypothetical protein
MGENFPNLVTLLPAELELNVEWRLSPVLKT